MTSHLQTASWILLLTSATLFWVALKDLRHYKIPNEAVLVLAGLYFLYAVAAGQLSFVPWNVGFALVTLAGMIYIYSLKQMGGGDIKLLAIAFLWTGPWSVLPFAALFLLFVGIYYLAVRLGWATAEKSAAGLRIPVAPSVAGALISVFALGLLPV